MSSSQPQPAQFRNLPRSRRKQWRVSERYDPLGTCPAPLRYLYAKPAKNAAAGSLPAMVKLKCLECCCWNREEVKRCELVGCALYARTRREPVQ